MRTKYHLILFTILCGLLLATAFLLGTRPVQAQNPLADNPPEMALTDATDDVQSPAQAEVINPFPPSGWDYACADCPYNTEGTNNHNLRVDSQGRMHVAFGDYKLFYGVFEGGTWQLEVADNEMPHGQFSSLVLDADGNPYICYRDLWKHGVYLASKDASGWHNEMIYQANSGGYTSVEIDPQGQLHVLFMAYVDDDIQPLIHGYRDDSGWHFDTVDDTGIMGYQNAMTFDADGYPHVSYIDYTTSSDFRLWYAYQDASGWHREIVEDPLIYGGYGGSSIALASNGQPVIAYNYIDTQAKLRVARRQSNGAWLKEDAYTGNVTGSYQPSLFLDENDFPHILSSGDQDGYSTSVAYTYQDGDGWHFQLVDPVNFNGADVSLARDAAGKLYALYRGQGNSTTSVSLKNYYYATLEPESSTWITGTIAPYGDAGTYSSLVLDADDHPHIASFDTTNDDIRYAYWDGAAWHSEVAAWDAAEDWPINPGPSLVLDADGNPHLAYTNHTKNWLAYGSRDAGGWHFEHVTTTGAQNSLSLALGPDGFPRIAHTASNVGYSYLDDIGWHTEIITTTDSRYASLAVDANGYSHISFFTHHSSSVNNRLWYAYQDAEGWHSEMVNTPEASGAAYGTSLVLDADGNPHIASVNYQANTDFPLIYSYKKEGVWHSTVLDSATSGYPNIAVDSQGYAHITYPDDVYGTYPEKMLDIHYIYEDAAGWHDEGIDTVMLIFPWPDIALDSQDRPFISYADYYCLALMSKTAPIDSESPTLPNAPGSDSPLIAPAQGATVYTPQPFFDWADGEDNVGVFSYTLVITGNGTQGVQSIQTTVYQESTTESQYTPDFDLPNGSYSWTVRAYDAAGNASAWAEPRQFTVSADIHRIFLPFLVRR
jgi:hypothetical protein